LEGLPSKGGDPALLGSPEFASTIAGSRFILVLGHTGCSAIKGA